MEGNLNLTFRCKDGILLHVNRRDIETYSAGFASAGIIEAGALEEIPLEETSHTMEILFAFMKLQPQPELSDFSLKDLLNVGEASQKYIVYPANQVIRLEIKYVSLHVKGCQTYRILTGRG